MDSSERRRLAVWAGVECTYNRVGDSYFDQLELGAHYNRAGTASLLESLGIGTLRFPILWEKTAPGALRDADWTWPDRELHALRGAGIDIIAGLVHHGSGPPHTSLLDPDFATKLAAYAGAVAARYPWIDAWTPVNEPLTTARFSGLYGLWYPHRRDDAAFVTALLNQCRAIVLSMQAIRAVNPRARLVQTDDLGKTWGTEEMASVTQFYNERRWLAWDVLCGLVVPGHALWDYLIAAGADEDALLWFREHRCPPDVVGVNYYVTSERWLDHRTGRYPDQAVGMIDGRAAVDLVAARAMATPIAGVEPLLWEAWQRYGLPLAITEAHIDAGREDQLRWFHEVYRSAELARDRGADILAVTAWSMFGAFNWNSLVTRDDGYYESGVFDVRTGAPRPTAITGLLRQLADGEATLHPTATGAGWWRRAGRMAHIAGAETANAWAPDNMASDAAVRPIMISGASGTLGRAFARVCAQRNIAFRLLSRADMDITDPASVAGAIDRHRPWAVINASGYVRVDQAEQERERCFRENAWGPQVLAMACAANGIHLTIFSSDMVFDGKTETGYLESDPVSPINVYGKSKAIAEEAVQARLPGALVIRTSAFFGPWDTSNFVGHALHALERGKPFMAASDIIVTPTYVPDLVHTCLDLVIDKESGIWHLTNGDALSWMDLARRAAARAAIDPASLQPAHASSSEYPAPRPPNSTLLSHRGIFLPSLQHALDRYVSVR